MENNDNSGVDSNNSRITYTYPMVKETDMTESMKADVSTQRFICSIPVSTIIMNIEFRLLNLFRDKVFGFL